MTTPSVFTILLICLYFAPGITAAVRKRKNANAIAVANLLFGWTGLGWGVTLVWALKND
jgi:hypothetical protein